MTEMILPSSVLILAVILLRRALRGRIAPGLQYALWLLAALRLLIPGPLFPAPVSAAGAAEELRSALVRQEASAGPREVIPGGLADAPGVVSPAVTAPPDRNSGGSVPAERAVLLPWPVLLWGAGALAVGGAFLASNLAFFLRLRRGRKRLCLPMETGAWETPVYLVKDIASPCVSGLWKPAVYVNEAALRTENFEHILLHELTHIRHGDHWWALVRCVCLTVHWFNPLVWWAAVLSRRDCETACDAGVIRRLGEERRLDYGQTLLRMIIARPGPRDLLRASTYMSAGKRTMAERLRLIAQRPRMLKLTLAAVAAIMCGVVVFTFGGRAENGEPELDPAPPAAAPEGPSPQEPDSAAEDEPLPGFTAGLVDFYARVHPSGMFALTMPEAWFQQVIWVDGPDSAAFYDADLYQEGTENGWLMRVVPQPVSWAEMYSQGDIALEEFDFNGSPYLYMVELNQEPDLSRDAEKTRALMDCAQELAEGFRLLVTEESLYTFVRDCVENDDIRLAISYLPYLRWSGYREVCGEEGMQALLDKLYTYIQTCDVTWGETHNILSNRSLNDPAIDGAYATMIQEGILLALQEKNPEQFSSVLNSIYLTDGEREDILEWLRPVVPESPDPVPEAPAEPDGQTLNAWQRGFFGFVFAIPAAPDQELYYDSLHGDGLEAAVLDALGTYARDYVGGGDSGGDTRFNRIILEEPIPAAGHGEQVTVSYQIECLRDRTYEGKTYSLAPQAGDHLSTTFTVMDLHVIQNEFMMDQIMGESGD